MRQVESFGRKDGRVGGLNGAKPRTSKSEGVGWLIIALASFAVVGSTVLWLATHPRPKALPVAEGLASSIEFLQAFGDPSGRAADLIQRYPHDPRLRFVHGRHLLSVHDLAAAERELRIGLSQVASGAPSVAPDVELGLRTLLVAALLKQGSLADAKVAAQPLCANKSSSPSVAKARSALRRSGMCD